MTLRRCLPSPMRLAWLVLALAGLAAGLDRGPAVPRGGDAIAALTLGLWCIVETGVRRNWPALLTLPALALGPGAALPLYLFIRSRRVV